LTFPNEHLAATTSLLS